MPSPIARSKPITVSIVSHGQLALILPLIEQLSAHCAHLIDKLVLTLNIEEPDLLAEQDWGFPVVRIENSTPKGFGANHNQAFGHSETAWYLVLNPDIRLHHDVLTPMLSQAAEKSGLLAPRVHEPGTLQAESHRALLTPLEIWARRRTGYAPPASPAWIPGLFMLFRSPAYRVINGFDERYFMYAEDCDICLRLQLNDWLIQIAADQRVLHEAQRASHRSRRHLAWHVRSLIRLWTSSSYWRFRSAQKPLIGPL